MLTLEHKQFPLSITSILGPQESLSKLPELVLGRLISIPCVSLVLLCMQILSYYSDLVDTLLSSSWPHLEKVLKPLISSLIGRYVLPLTHGFDLIDRLLLRRPTGDELTVLRQLLLSPTLSSELLGHGCSTLVSSVVDESECGPLQDLLSELYQRHPMEVRNAIKAHVEEDDENDKDEYSLIASLSLVS